MKNKIKSLRKIKGLSKQELAKRSGISTRMIHYYENESASIPLEKIKKLAYALEISVEELISEQEETKIKSEYINILDVDVQKVKKIQKLLSLSSEEQSFVFKMIDLLHKKNK